jgi:hypothetical protein
MKKRQNPQRGQYSMHFLTIFYFFFGGRLTQKSGFFKFGVRKCDFPLLFQVKTRGGGY